MSMARYDTIKRIAETNNPQIKIVGCGGAGCNSINRLKNIGVYGAETIAVNTDKNHLQGIDADRKLLIGRSVTRGMGAGGIPEVGERCAELSEDVLTEVVDGADMTFVIAGMGGGTGTGVAPFVSKLAKRTNSVVVGMTTTPFKAERGRRQAYARHGLEKFRKNADSVIVLENDRLLNIVPNMPFERALSIMDQLISEVIKGITEAITIPSMINLDIADLKTVIKTGGASTIMYGENSTENPGAVVEDALNSPFMDIDYSHAKSALVHLTSGPSLPIKTVHEVVDGLTSQFDDNSHIILGVRNDDRDYDGVVKVMTIVTGARSAGLLGPDDGLLNENIEAIDESIGFID